MRSAAKSHQVLHDTRGVVNSTASAAAHGVAAAVRHRARQQACRLSQHAESTATPRRSRRSARWVLHVRPCRRAGAARRRQRHQNDPASCCSLRKVHCQTNSLSNAALEGVITSCHTGPRRPTCSSAQMNAEHEPPHCTTRQPQARGPPQRCQTPTTWRQTRKQTRGTCSRRCSWLDGAWGTRRQIPQSAVSSCATARWATPSHSSSQTSATHILRDRQFGGA